MSIASAQNAIARFGSANAQIAAITAPGGILSKLQAEFKNTSQFNVALVNTRVAARLTQAVRQVLMQSYQRSRLGTFSKHKHTGNLARAVSQSEVAYTPKGFRIRLPAGLPAQLYAQSGALEYGSVRGLHGSKATNKRQGKFIKKTGKSIAGGSLVAAHEYYNIDAGMSLIESRYAQYFQEEADKLLRRSS